MDYSAMTDAELDGTRKSMPKYLNDCTPEQEAITNAVYAEQQRRYDTKKAADYQEYNQQVEAAGYRAGDKVSCFVTSWTGCGGEHITGTVAKRKKYYVALDKPFNGNKSTHLTKAWRIEP